MLMKLEKKNYVNTKNFAVHNEWKKKTNPHLKRLNVEFQQCRHCNELNRIIYTLFLDNSYFLFCLL